MGPMKRGKKRESHSYAFHEFKNDHVRMVLFTVSVDLNIDKVLFICALKMAVFESVSFSHHF